MKTGSEAYQCDSEGVLTKVEWIKLFWNQRACLYCQSEHKHTIGNQLLNISVWNKGTLLWLALTFVRFQFRSALTQKAWTGKDRWLFDRVIAGWNLTFSQPRGIQVAAPCHSNLPDLFISLRVEQWGAGGCRLTFHLTSWWILLLISSCQKLYSQPQSRSNERWFSKYCSNPKCWHKKALTIFLNI